MSDDAKLLPPISRINARLTAVAREQRRLRTLLALAVEAKADAETLGSDPPLDIQSHKSNGRPQAGRRQVNPPMDPATANGLDSQN